MKLNRMITLLVLALLMALCMVLVACGTDPIAVGENPGAHEHDQTPGEDEGTDGDVATPGSVCLHKNYTLVNKKSADCQNEGYTGDKVCSACEKLFKACEGLDGELFAKRRKLFGVFVISSDNVNEIVSVIIIVRRVYVPNSTHYNLFHSKYTGFPVLLDV